MVGVPEGLAVCLPWCSGVSVSCGVCDLLAGLTQAFFQCGRTHVLHDPHLFFWYLFPTRGVFGSVEILADECLLGLVVGVGRGVVGPANTW